MLIAALLATAATVAAFEDCGGRNTSTSPHRLLSGALLVWGRAQGLRGAEGRAWFHLAKALNLCDADRISSAMEAPGALGDMLGEDLDAALRATTHAFRGDARRAALGFAQAAELAASLTDDAARMRAPLLLYLHGRSAFVAVAPAAAEEAAGEAAEARNSAAEQQSSSRHLQGGYLEWDDALSFRRVLRDRLAAAAGREDGNAACSA